jgi:putative ABC transport system substrate-binding protein
VKREPIRAHLPSATELAAAARYARLTRRRCLLAAMALWQSSGATFAQARKRPHRVGYLTISPRAAQVHLVEAFERGLRERGYVLGRDLVIEYRFADGKPDRLRGLADDLVRAQVDVILTGVNPNIRAAQAATRSIPIVAANAYFPVEDGLVQSLARPGGNITGLTTDADEEISRRLQILREAVPALSRVGAIYGVGEDYMSLALGKLEAPARRLGVAIVPVEFRGAADLERAFAHMSAEKSDSLIGFGAATLTHRASIIRMSMQARLPTIFADKRYVDDGALLSYGVDLADLFRRAAGYVDRILKGATPAELPFEQPTRYVLAVNLKTASALGVAIPRTLMLQADHVIGG